MGFVHEISRYIHTYGRSVGRYSNLDPIKFSTFSGEGENTCQNLLKIWLQKTKTDDMTDNTFNPKIYIFAIKRPQKKQTTMTNKALC